MKKHLMRQIHKWMGIFSCLFILLVSVTALALSHPELYKGWYEKPSQSDFSLNQAVAYALDPFDAQHLMASSGKALYQSHDGGQSWSEVKLFVPAEKIYTLAFSPAQPDWVWVALKEVGIYFSEDSGEIWEEIEDIPFNPVEGEYIQRLQVSAAHDLLVETELGHYQYQAQAGQWQQNKHISNHKQVLTLKDWIYRLHTGKFDGQWGLYLYDAIAITLILLAISGLYLSFKPKGKSKKRGQSGPLKKTTSELKIKVPEASSR